MKLIIEITEKDYKRASMGLRTNVDEVIKNGTPLKKHDTEEQEPCDDCISRRAVLYLKQTFYDNAGYKTDYVDIEDIKELPPVYPKNTDVLDKIRAEIEAISVYGQVDKYTMYTRTGEQVRQVALDIIDKYRKEIKNEHI